MDYNFDIIYASRYGVNEAIILKNLIYWIRHNQVNGRNKLEGKTWTYNTIEAWGKQYPFWSESQLRRILKSLESQKVIIKRYKFGHDRTSCYALADESMLELPESRNPTTNNKDTPPEKEFQTQPQTESNNKNASAVDALFNDLWNGYPSKIGRKAAERHYHSSVKTKEDMKNIQIALSSYKNSKRVKDGFIMNGSSWFNNWKDWVEYKEPVAQVEKEEKPKFVDYKPLIRRRLGRIATDEMIKDLLMEIPEKYWWLVDKFLKDTYTGSSGISHLESEIKREEFSSV